MVTNLVGVERNWPPTTLKPWAQDDYHRVIPRRDEYLMGLTLPLLLPMNITSIRYLKRFLYDDVSVN